MKHHLINSLLARFKTWLRRWGLTWKRRWRLLTNGKISDEELNVILSYYAYASSFFGKKNVPKEDRDRIFNTFIALNELKELRKYKEREEFKKNARNRSL